MIRKLLLYVLILCAVPALSQIRILEAHAVSINYGKWELIDPPAKIVVEDEVVSIYTVIFQEYNVISQLYKSDSENETSSTWLCVDKDGTRCHVTLGIVSNDPYGYYLLIKYSDWKWLYRCYLKD